MGSISVQVTGQGGVPATGVSAVAVNVTGKRRRWLLGLEPIFEGGWLHKGGDRNTFERGHQASLVP